MARRKSTKAAGDPPPSNRRLSVQCCDEWLGWVEEGADFCRTDLSKLVDAALAEYLEKKGFEKKPPKRVP